MNVYAHRMLNSAINIGQKISELPFGFESSSVICQSRYHIKIRDYPSVKPLPGCKLKTILVGCRKIRSFSAGVLNRRSVDRYRSEYAFWHVCQIHFNFFQLQNVGMMAFQLIRELKHQIFNGFRTLFRILSDVI